MRRTVRIVGTGATALGRMNMSADALMQEALERSLASSGFELRQLDGLVAVPSLSNPHFMEAHYLCTRMGLLPKKRFVVRTVDTGGAGPVTALLQARRYTVSQKVGAHGCHTGGCAQ